MDDEENGEETVRTRRNTVINDMRSNLKKNIKYRRNSVTINQKMIKKLRKQASQEECDISITCSSDLKSQSNKGQYEAESFDKFYTTGKTLGQGCNGIVKQCTHIVSQKEYVVKIIKMEDQHVFFLKSNFVDVKYLKHPNIIRYRALYTDEKKHVCFLVMEKCSYPSLEKYRFSNVEELRSVIQQLCKAIDYMHSSIICHRDLKPQNILYDSGSRKIKIIDFGVSKKYQKRGIREDMYTNTGTLYYKAPEMFSGCYNEKVDIWALGVTIYKLVTGLTPFQSEYLSDTIDNICNAEPSFQEKEWDLMPKEMRNLMNGLLRKKPSERLDSREIRQHFWFQVKASDLSENNILYRSDFNLANLKFQSELVKGHDHKYMKKKSSFMVKDNEKLNKSNSNSNQNSERSADHSNSMKQGKKHMLKKLMSKKDQIDHLEFELIDSDADE